MFRKENLDAFYEELNQAHEGQPGYDQIIRDAHLGIALSDAGRPLDNIGTEVAALIEKHKPSA